jgi:hypothetical protein
MVIKHATPIVFIGVAALMAVVAGQSDNAQLPQPTFRAEANFVRVDAFPTTKDGVAVTDLTAADFEIVEDKSPQKIEQFERVVIRAVGSAEGRPEPNTVAESRRAVQDPRARVFVLFLDPAHVEEGAGRLRWHHEAADDRRRRDVRAQDCRDRKPVGERLVGQT